MRGRVWMMLALSGACSGSIRGGEIDRGPGVYGTTAERPGGAAGASGEAAGASGGDAGAGAQAPGTGTQTACSEQGLLAIAQESLRLNDWQLDNALRALFPFEVTLDPAPGTTTTGDNLFSTFPGANEVLISDARDLVSLSESLALQAAARAPELLACDPSAEGEAPCIERFVRAFGAKAFRRPLQDDEVERFMTVFAAVRGDASDPLELDLALGALVQAIVLSPELQYLIERGAPTATPGVLVLTGHEIASRLSFLFWNAPPDEALLARAEAGELQDPEARRQEAARLFDDARSQATVERFVGEWFGVADQVFVDHAPLPLAEAFAEEVRRLSHATVYGGGVVGDLLERDTTFVNQPLAEHYGIADHPSRGADDWHELALPEERRGGLLTTAQFAAATSHNNATSIIHRGKAVRERLLCGELGTPDPSFLAMNPMLGPDATVRERMDARMQMQPCGGCHVLMDPIGIGMEDLDENGLFRSAYGNGHGVDAAGEIALPGDLAPSFRGAVELAHALARSQTLERCAADQWLRYTAGRRRLGEHAECFVERILQDAQASGGTLRDLMLAVVASDAFVYRLAEE